MSGYWQPEYDAAIGQYSGRDAIQPIFRDGYLITEDLATVSEFGFLTIVDRIKNVIIVSGENVWPAEVERILELHDMVDRAFVYGIDDDVLGEKVHAVVVYRKDNAVEGNEVHAYMNGQKEKQHATQEAILRTHCQQYLAWYKVRDIIFTLFA